MTADERAKGLVDGFVPGHETTPIFSRQGIEPVDGWNEGGLVDVLTLTRVAYRGLIAAAIREAEAAAEQRAAERAARMIRHYLAFDNQRPASWHEVQDCAEAITAGKDVPEKPPVRRMAPRRKRNAP